MTEEKIIAEENAEESAPAEVETAPPKTEKLPEAATPVDEPEAVPEKAEEAAPEEAAPEEAAPEEAASEEAASEEAPEEAAEEEPEEEGKKKKIRHLSLEEVEKKLNRARIKMGGEASVYVRHLKARKRELEGSGE